MADRVLKKLEAQGKLRRQKAGLSQVEALLRQASLDLQEAEKVKRLAERATYLLAYIALLKAGRALLLYHGFVPDDGAQHRTVVEATSAMLGEKYRVLTLTFERMRRKRNEMTYEAGALLSKTEAERAFKQSRELVQGIFEKIKSHNPQMHLKF